MWAALGIQALNQYGKMQEAKENRRRAAINNAKAKASAAQMITMGYSQILRQSAQQSVAAKRRIEDIKIQERQVTGAATVQAAQAGVEGRRAELHQRATIGGAAAREVSRVSADARSVQEELIDRADALAQETLMRLNDGMVDMPAGYNPISGALDIGVSYLSAKQDEADFNLTRKKAIIAGAEGGNSGRYI